MFSTAASVNEQREGWERIIQKIRTGEMPPKGFRARLPPNRTHSSNSLKANSTRRTAMSTRSRPRHCTSPEPPRIRQHDPRPPRVDFRAEKDFPSDDSGNGFDNISDVLTISPVLMEKYSRPPNESAPEPSSRPAPEALEALYHARDKTIRGPTSAPSRPPSHRVGRRVCRPHRTARRTRRRPQTRHHEHLDGRQVASLDAGRNQAVETWCTSIRSRTKRCAQPPKATTSSALDSSTTLSSKASLRRKSTVRKKNKYLSRSPSSDIRCQNRTPQPQEISSAIRIQAPPAWTESSRL